MGFLNEQGFDLPWYTRWLINTSNAFVNYWYIILGVPIGIFFLLYFMYKMSDAARYKIDQFFLWFPKIGQVILKINLARYTRFFSITFASGLGILECLGTARDVINNAVLKESGTSIIKDVTEGSTITNALQRTERFPSLVVRMFKVGEESGNMDEALEHVNFFYEREVDDSVEAMVQMIQPTLTVVLGLLMFWIIAAVFGPIYSNFSNMDF